MTVEDTKCVICGKKMTKIPFKQSEQLTEDHTYQRADGIYMICKKCNKVQFFSGPSKDD